MDIKEARNKIDEIDEKLTELFKERMAASLEVAKYKKENNLPVFVPAREREILNKVTLCAGKELESYVKALYLSLFDISRTYQKQQICEKSDLIKKIEKVVTASPANIPNRASVACQGVEGAYSQHACEKLFEFPTISYYKSFEGVFKAVESGECRYGILPVENSTAGSVTAVYDLMNKYHFYITAGVKLFIEHKLLCPKGTVLNDVKEIFSHEQAINQCSQFLSTLSGVKITPMRNTAAAAEAVSKCKRSDVAAIGSADCAELYGLQVIETEGLRNTDNNYTRFICISKNLEIYPGACKTSIILSLPHKAGALYNTMSRFACLGLNLTKIESRPIPGSNFEFKFYFDIDSSVYNKSLLTALTLLEDECDEFTYLGSYTEK